MIIKDKMLFMKYAVPCAETLVKRGAITEGQKQDMILLVSSGKTIEHPEKIFKVAYAMCMLIAKKTGKKYIDEDVIREYFLHEHDDAVDKRFEEMCDFDPDECRVYRGKVIDIKGMKAKVNIEGREKYFRTEFCKDIKINENVIVHRDFVVERYE